MTLRCLPATPQLQVQVSLLLLVVVSPLCGAHIFSYVVEPFDSQLEGGPRWPLPHRDAVGESDALHIQAGQGG